MKNYHSDLVWSFLLCVISISIFIYSGTFESTSAVVHPLAKSSVYSRIWAIILLILSLVQLVKTLKCRDMRLRVPLLTIPALISIVSVLSYLLLLKYLGFVLCTVLFLILLMTYYHWLSLQASERNNLKIGTVCLKFMVLSLILSGAFYFIFGYLLGVYLPIGALVEALIY